MISATLWFIAGGVVGVLVGALCAAAGSDADDMGDAYDREAGG